MCFGGGLVFGFVGDCFVLFISFRLCWFYCIAGFVVFCWSLSRR